MMLFVNKQYSPIRKKQTRGGEPIICHGEKRKMSVFFDWIGDYHILFINCNHSLFNQAAHTALVAHSQRQGWLSLHNSSLCNQLF